MLETHENTLTLVKALRPIPVGGSITYRGQRGLTRLSEAEKLAVGGEGTRVTSRCRPSCLERSRTKNGASYLAGARDPDANFRL
jgi:hypothetical protein